MTTQTLRDKAGLSRPLVVARRWDQLGGRLSAIVNALSLAELFGLEFRFVWPRGADDVVNEPAQIFTQAFLDAYEIGASELEALRAIPHRELVSLSASEAAGKLREADSGLFVDVDENFDVVRGGSESAETASDRYERCWQALDWCEDVRGLKAACDQLRAVDDLAAVHVRAGDIVTGPWRQVIVHEKYLPTAFVEHAIERLADRGRSSVLVLSDNAPYLAWLSERYPTAVTTAELVPGYAGLTELHQALADIFVLAGCARIVGPPNSAFSRLAANLGAGNLVRADQLIAPGQERDLLLAAVARHGKPGTKPDFRDGLIARDICWALDVFADTLPIATQHELARQAVALDPDFSGAAARLARIGSVVGELPEAESAAARALGIAEAVERCADPLLEALASDVVLKCFAAARVRPPWYVQTGWLAATRFSERWESEDRESMRLLFAEMEQSLSRCLELHPFWAARQRVIDDLRELIARTERLCAQPAGVRRRVASAFGPGRADPPASQRPSFSSLEEHRALDMYDPLSRDLDRLVFQLGDAMGGAQAATDCAQR